MIIVAVALAASASIVLLRERPEEVEEFVEIYEMFIHVDEGGNAVCQCTDDVPPSKLADFARFMTQTLGTDRMEQNFIEAIRAEYATYGLEVRNPNCQIAGLKPGQTYQITLSWEMPNFARRMDNHWTVTLEWIDNQSAAQEEIAQLNVSWAQVRGISTNAQYRISAKVFLILPEGAENIYYLPADGPRKTDYGGGSHSESSLGTEQIDGRLAIVETCQSSLVAKNEPTITPQQLLENYMTFTVEYDGTFSTENMSFVSSVNQVRLDLKYGRELDERYPIFDGGSLYSLTPAQILYHSADAVVTLAQGGQFSLPPQPIEVDPPNYENGDWEASWRNISKNEYIDSAQAVLDNMGLTGKAPSTVSTPIGNIRFTDALFALVRVLSFYDENKELPSELLFAPVPRGELSLGVTQVPASHAYFLLPDADVIKGGNRATQILDDVRAALSQAGLYDNRKLVEELCKWVSTNITYQFPFIFGLTSEEVLEYKRGQCGDFTNACLALTRTAGMPARRISGWVTQTEAWTPPAGWEFVVGTTPDGIPLASHAWVQVFLPDEGWVPVEPQVQLGYLPYEVYKAMPQTWRKALAAYETAYEMI